MRSASRLVSRLLVRWQSNPCVLTIRLSDGIGNFAQAQGVDSMAWFERNTGGKKDPNLEAERTPETAKTAGSSNPMATSTLSAAAVKSAELPASIAGLVGYLYKGSRVSGHLSFQGSARIDGTVDGDIHCQGTLTIGESAEVKARITAQAAIIYGKVEGNVSAREKIELIAPARLVGDIETSRLIITEGVFFEGDCSMGVAQAKGGVVGSHNAVADKAAGAQSAKANN